MQKMIAVSGRILVLLVTTLLSSAVIFYLCLIVLVRPSLDRDWSVDQAILPYAQINGTDITIRNIRNFNYRSTSDYDIAYYDKTFDLNKLESVWFAVEPFSGYQGAAHTLVSFGFEDGNYVAVSVEIRKEKGEKFSAGKGLLRKYEIMYVIADERDVIKLRSNFRKDQVFLYPIKTTPERMRAMFLSMLNRANKLAVKPEFYNTLTSTCTTNIVRHVNEIVPGRIPVLRTAILFPANSDQLAYELGLIDTTLSFEKAREHFLINDRAEKYGDSADFSEKIRAVE